MNLFKLGVISVQVGTFLVLGVWFLEHRDWRLGTAQLLLAAVQTIIYSGSMS